MFGDMPPPNGACKPANVHWSQPMGWELGAAWLAGPGSGTLMKLQSGCSQTEAGGMAGRDCQFRKPGVLVS